MPALKFIFEPMSQQQACAVAGWKYEGIYAFYDWSADADDLAELLDPQRREDGGYLSVLDDAGSLIGFYGFTSKESTAEFGLGLRPDLTGQGLGTAFLSAGLEHIRESCAPTTFKLQVAAFNERAIKVYERAGFQRVRDYRHKTNRGEFEFVEMSRPA